MCRINVPDAWRICQKSLGCRWSVDDEIIVICHHGMRSFQVASYLEGNGFKNIVNLEGGVDAWARSVDPDMPVY